jgi:hypothetical protein
MTASIVSTADITNTLPNIIFCFKIGAIQKLIPVGINAYMQAYKNPPTKGHKGYIHDFQRLPLSSAPADADEEKDGDDDDDCDCSTEWEIDDELNE